MTEERNNMLPLLGAAAGAAAGAGGFAGLTGAAATMAGAGLGMGVGGVLSQGFGEKAMGEEERAENERRNAMNQLSVQDAYRMNNEGVMSLANRGFEVGTLNPMLQTGFLGTGLTPSSIGIGMEMAELSRQAESARIKMAKWDESNPKPAPQVVKSSGFLGIGGGARTDYTAVRRWEADRRAFMEPLQQQVAALNANTQQLAIQKETADRGALMDVSESYKPLAQAAHQTASGIFDDSLYGREVAATQPVWDIRGEMDPLRREYLPQFESAEMAMTDPQRYAALQQLAIDRAEALRDPETAALRLEGVDPAYLQGIQALREQQATAGATAAQMGAQEQLGQLALGRAYGGSSTASNRLMANVMGNALQQASQQRLANQMTAGLETEEARRQMVQQRMLNVADTERVDQALLGAKFTNEQQRLQALREQQEYSLAGLGRRQDVDTQGVTDRLATADELRKLTLQDELRKIANPMLPFDMNRAANQAIMQPSLDYNRLQTSALGPLQFGKVGVGNLNPVPTMPYQATPSTGQILGTAAGSLASNLGGLYASNQQQQQMMDLQKRGFKNQQKLQEQWLDRRYPASLPATGGQELDLFGNPMPKMA